MTSFPSNYDELNNNSNNPDNEEASIYSDCCSNSLELENFIKKKEEIQKSLIEKKINELKNLKQNDSNSFSLSDINNQSKKGSNFSFNSTNSTLYIKKNCKNLQKINVNIPRKSYFNNKYTTNTSNLLSPIEEKGNGIDLLLPVFSAENKKQQMSSELKDFHFIRQSLEQKNTKFIFSPNININQNYFNFKNNINLNIKKKVFSSTKEKNKKESNNENNKDININVFIDTKRSKNKNSVEKSFKEKKKNKVTSSFILDDSMKKHNSINSSLEIKKFLKFDKITKISEIEFNGINKDEIDLNFLKQKLRTIPVKSYKKTSKEKYIKNLVEVQNFFVEKSPVWVMKMSKNYEYLATGGKNGSIKIFSFFNYNSDDFDFIYTKKNILNYFKFISEKPILNLNQHKKDIIDLSWSPYNFELLLSASVDNYVILWDISKTNGDNIIKKFNHNDIVTSVNFSPFEPNIFVTGCFDKFIRFFKIDDSVINKDENINNTKLNESKSTINVNFNHFNNNVKNKISFDATNIIDENDIDNKFDMPYYFNIKEIITTVEFFPDGGKLAIGTHNGKIIVYNINNDIHYDYSFNCRNKLGKFSSGKKVTNINFIDKYRALITTSDSRIRLMNMNNGKIIHKYKGHQNLNSMIRSSTDLCNDILICGSEDNFCYIWDLFNTNEKEIKNYKYEYFKPFAKENIYCSFIVPEICYTNYIKKIYKLTNKINIISIIITATDNGRLEILLNAEEN